MDIPVNAEVWCTDGLCGRSVELIVNPAEQHVTHVVVLDKRVPPAERLVPVENVAEATPQLIRLTCSADELAGFESFVEREYITIWPSESISMMPQATVVTLTHERMPVGEVGIHKGAQVEATDGRVGRVDGLLINPADECITHLVLREGHLWGQRDVTIPVSQIEAIEEDRVYLKLDKRGVEALPAVPVRRATDS